MYNSKYHQRALIAKHSLNQLKLRNQRASLMSVPCVHTVSGQHWNSRKIAYMFTFYNCKSNVVPLTTFTTITTLYVA